MEVVVSWSWGIKMVKLTDASASADGGAALRNPTPRGRETVSLNQSYQAPFLHQLFPELCVHSRGNTGSLMRHARPANTLENPYEMGVLINLCQEKASVPTGAMLTHICDLEQTGSLLGEQGRF